MAMRRLNPADLTGTKYHVDPKGAVALIDGRPDNRSSFESHILDASAGWSAGGVLDDGVWYSVRLVINQAFWDGDGAFDPSWRPTTGYGTYVRFVLVGSDTYDVTVKNAHVGVAVCGWFDEGSTLEAGHISSVSLFRGSRRPLTVGGKDTFTLPAGEPVETDPVLLDINQHRFAILGLDVMGPVGGGDYKILSNCLAMSVVEDAAVGDEENWGRFDKNPTVLVDWGFIQDVYVSGGSDTADHDGEGFLDAGAPTHKPWATLQYAMKRATDADVVLLGSTMPIYGESNTVTVRDFEQLTVSPWARPAFGFISVEHFGKSGAEQLYSVDSHFTEELVGMWLANVEQACGGFITQVIDGQHLVVVDASTGNPIAWEPGDTGIVFGAEQMLLDGRSLFRPLKVDASVEACLLHMLTIRRGRPEASAYIDLPAPTHASALDEVYTYTTTFPGAYKLKIDFGDGTARTIELDAGSHTPDSVCALINEAVGVDVAWVVMLDPYDNTTRTVRLYSVMPAHHGYIAFHDVTGHAYAELLDPHYVNGMMFYRLDVPMGGGVLVEGPGVELLECTLEENRAPYGGALCNRVTSKKLEATTLTGCRIQNNATGLLQWDDESTLGLPLYREWDRLQVDANMEWVAFDDTGLVWDSAAFKWDTGDNDTLATEEELYPPRFAAKGAGIYVEGGAVLADACVFVNNASSDVYVDLEADYAGMNVTHVWADGPLSTKRVPAAVIGLDEATVWLEHCLFWGCTAIRADLAKMTVRNSFAFGGGFDYSYEPLGSGQDPLFVSELGHANASLAPVVNLRLRSETASFRPAFPWTSGVGYWEQDRESSPFLDATDRDYGVEPPPHGLYANCGGYGTHYTASLSRESVVQDFRVIALDESSVRVTWSMLFADRSALRHFWLFYGTSPTKFKAQALYVDKFASSITLKLGSLYRANQLISGKSVEFSLERNKVWYFSLMPVFISYVGARTPDFALPFRMSSSLNNPDLANLGLKQPFRFSRTGRLETESGSQKIYEAVMNIVQTNLGERVMRPSYGAGLNRLVFTAPSDATLVGIKTAIINALSEDPRVVVREVKVYMDSSSASGEMVVQVQYQEKGTGAVVNLNATL